MKPTLLGASLSLVALSLMALSVSEASAQQQADTIDTDASSQQTDAVDILPDGRATTQPAYKTRPANRTETNCSDGVDNDNDGVIDCADADCYDDPACKPDGQPENTNERCSDWIDNDGDGVMDCDDPACNGPDISVCRGSWREPGSVRPGGTTLPSGRALEELLEKSGERNDIVCSDGIDNDGNGLIDCNDPGCRFDPSVTVCTGNPDVRFSVVAQIAQSHYFEMSPDSTLPTDDTAFQTLQLRALGPIRGIQNSFFLVSMRAEKNPRLSFAMIQIPVGERYYINVNSGGGSLSTGLIKSAAKRPLIDPPYYLYSSFEQGNGAAVDFGGTVSESGFFRFRAYVAGGSGRFNGNIGGKYFRDEDVGNYTYSVGAQIFLNFLGYSDRMDTGFLYTSAATAATVSLGGKYDQRALERYPAFHGGLVFRHKRIILEVESYFKRELEFKSTQLAYNITGGVLIVPKWLFLAADYGAFVAGNLENPPDSIYDTGTDVRKQRDEWQARGALHLYFYRNVGVLSALYTYRDVKSSRDQKDGYIESEGRLVASYWF